MNQINENIRKSLGRRINITRKEKGLTAEKLSEMCHINATYLRQIESGVKIPSLPVFVDICNHLNVSSDYLLQDSLSSQSIMEKEQLGKLWNTSSPTQLRLISSMIQVALKCMEENETDV